MSLAVASAPSMFLQPAISPAPIRIIGGGLRLGTGPPVRCFAGGATSGVGAVWFVAGPAVCACAAMAKENRTANDKTTNVARVIRALAWRRVPGKKRSRLYLFIASVIQRPVG